MCTDDDSSHLPRLSVVIPTFNRRDLILRCLATVVRYKPEDAEVLVVDDGSTDETRVAVQSRFPSVRVISLESNQGFCRAANAGWRAASGDVVELLNNDTEVAPSWALPALHVFRDPTIGAVAPLVRRLPFRKYVDSAGDTCGFLARAKKRGEGKCWRDVLTAPRDVFSASASSAFYRRAALKAAGGFPEHFGAYFDDVELGYRLRQCGYCCQFEPRSTVFHWVSQTHQVSSSSIQQQVSRNAERLFWPRLKGADAGIWAGLRLSYLLMWLSHRAIKGSFAPAFAGKCEFLADLSPARRG